MSSFAKGNPFSLSGTSFFGTPCFLFFFWFFLSPAKVGSLEMQPGAKLQAYLGVSILQPHACTQRFRLESFAGRGQMLDGRVLGASQVEYKPFGKPPLKREALAGLFLPAVPAQPLRAKSARCRSPSQWYHSALQRSVPCCAPSSEQLERAYNGNRLILTTWSCARLPCNQCLRQALSSPSSRPSSAGRFKEKDDRYLRGQPKRVAGFEVDLEESLRRRLQDPPGDSLSGSRPPLYWVDAALGTLNWALLPEGACTGAHFALISVELANSFWPRKLSAAPIAVFFKCKTLFKALVEHFIPRLQVVDKEETVGFPRCLLIQPVQLLLWQQGAQLLNNGVQLVLVAQPPAAEELHVHPHGCADEPQLLRAHPGAYLHVPAPDEESVQGAVGFMELRHIRKVVQDDQHLVQFLHLQLLGRLGDLALVRYSPPHPALCTS